MLKRAIKDCLPFDPAIALLLYIPQRDHRENNLYKNIHSHTLCGRKKSENEGMSFNWGMAEQVLVSVGDGILL